jgi:hypothetical protein
VIELSSRFENAFFSCQHPQRARPSFSCRRVPNYSTIQFSVKNKELQFVVEVYEKGRADCQFLVDATKKHFETGIAATPPKQLGPVIAVGPRVFSWTSVHSHLLWKIVLFQYQVSMKTLINFSALSETIDLLISINGFGEGDIEQFEELAKTLLDNLIVDPPSKWVENFKDKKPK